MGVCISAESLALLEDEHLPTGPLKNWVLAFGRPDGLWGKVLGQDGKAMQCFMFDMV